MAYHYAVFGLQLESNLEIPGLAAQPGSAPIDVRIRLAAMPPWLTRPACVSPLPDDRDAPAVAVRLLADGDYFDLAYSDATRFVVDRHGSWIWTTWEAPWTVQDMATYLLGPVLGFVLRLRGVSCLHASAVAVDDQAVALLGPAGSGKSTLAAALAGRGLAVITDDLLALTEADGQLWVQPAYARVRLWSDSAAALFGSAQRLPLLTPNWDKRYLDLTQDGFRFESRPLPLTAVYVLGHAAPAPVAPGDRSPATGAAPVRSTASDARRTETASPVRALMEMIANTYSTYVWDAGQCARELDVFARLVERVRVALVTAPRDFAALPALCDALLEDILSPAHV